MAAQGAETGAGAGAGGGGGGRGGEPPLFLVTGVSGFAAGWVAFAVLKAGYRCRGTVRSLKNEDKVKHLRDLCPGSKHKIELVEADLTDEASWPPAVEGCDYVLHVASPFPVGHPKDPENELYKPAIQGTLTVLKAATETQHKVKRVVITSSVAAVAYGQPPKEEFNENDWTDLDNPKIPVSPYARSKTLAEKAAWDYVASLPEDKKIELAVVNPSYIVGPLLSNSPCTSLELSVRLLERKMPGLPDLNFSFISVRDLAVAELRAALIPEAAGKRFVLVAGLLKVRELGPILAEEFNPYGYKVPTSNLSTWFLKLLSYVVPGMTDIVSRLGPPRNVVGVNTRQILKMDLDTDMKSLVTDMTLSGIAKGLIADVSEGKKLSSEPLKPADLDVAGFTWTA